MLTEKQGFALLYPRFGGLEPCVSGIELLGSFGKIMFSFRHKVVISAVVVAVEAGVIAGEEVEGAVWGGEFADGADGADGGFFIEEAGGDRITVLLRCRGGWRFWAEIFLPSSVVGHWIWLR
jgi:hypothetical protein